MLDLAIRFRMVLGVVLLLISPSVLYAAAGDLDPTFGVNGVVDTDLSVSSLYTAAIAIQPDGKILVAGSTSDTTLVLARYEADGTLDVTFGTAGFVTMNSVGDASVGDVTTDGSGNIFVLTAETTGMVTADIRTIKLDGTGAYDATFGIGGIATENTSILEIPIRVIALESGAVLVYLGARLIQYNSLGARDASFGAGGEVVPATEINGNGSQSGGAVALQPDGKILVGGLGYDDQPVMMRYGASGTPDGTFGVGGVVHFSLPADIALFSMVGVLEDGDITAAGVYATPALNTFGVRLNSDGTLGPDGITYLTDVPNLYSWGATEPNGNLVMLTPSSVLRMTSDGELDSGFAQGGQRPLTTDVFAGGLPLRLREQSDGKIVVVGPGPAPVYRIVRMFGAATTCAAAKEACVSKTVAARLKCIQKAQAGGALVSATCLTSSEAKFLACIQSADVKHVDCQVAGNGGAALAAVDAFVGDVVTDLDPGNGTPFSVATVNTCLAKKNGCVSKFAKALIACLRKAHQKLLPLDQTCTAKAAAKFDGGSEPAKGCFERVEPSGSCLTTDDTVLSKAKVEAFVHELGGSMTGQ